MVGRRVSAAAALVCLVAAIVAAAIEIVRDLPRGLVAVALLAAGVVVAWQALLRKAPARHVLAASGGLLLFAAVVVVLSGDSFGFGLAAVALLILGVAIARRVFRADAMVEAAVPPRRAVVVWNPRSGGGKAVSNNLADEARARGIEAIELKPGDDLVQLVRDAVARGADGLAAAGGDGTQALVASIAAEHDLPFACIPAGTRNHFALDLGVDRDDVVGALDAFVNGGERRVDLAEINGRVFVNNVSFGLYAEAVQREGYRDAKLRTILDTAPDVLAAQHDGPTAELGWRDPAGRTHESAAVILVSNNAYRLGRTVGSGGRPRMDAGELGVAVLQAPQAYGAGRLWQQWSAPAFEVTASQPVPVGVDGEALVLDPPLRLVSRPGALRVRIAPQHPGASPSAGLPEGALDTLRRLFAVAAGRDRTSAAAVPAGRWRTEEFLARPGRAVVWGGALLTLVLLLALLIPEGPLTIDSRWTELMQDIQRPFLTHVALVFNALGHGAWRALTLAGIGLVLLLARRWAALAAFAVAEALTPLFSHLIKLAVGRERPPGHMLEAHGTSFPSGHAAYAGATAVALVLLFSRPGRRRRLWFTVAVATIAAMAWSRTYLQVHWLSDALAGAALGVSVALLSFGAAQLILARPAGRRS
jgi:diacylglycerol kinase family enzyme/membrane-associated phospholipid phosphatase